jgi:CO/xanthine dehydrogenase Mo-binding subunit
MNAAAPQPKENMGAPAPRYDARLKVTGEARYPADVPMTNPAFAFLVTSSIAKGKLVSLDLAEARTVPGVIDILTQDDASVLHGGRFGQGSATSIDQLGPEIAHDGQIIALVLADSYEAAREAAYKVHANYAPAPASATFRTKAMPKQRWLQPTSSSTPSTARRRSITIRSSSSLPLASGKVTSSRFTSPASSSTASRMVSRSGSGSTPTTFGSSAISSAAPSAPRAP